MGEDFMDAAFFLPDKLKSNDPALHMGSTTETGWVRPVTTR
jgi:hypothetical protein